MLRFFLALGGAALDPSVSVSSLSSTQSSSLKLFIAIPSIPFTPRAPPTSSKSARAEPILEAIPSKPSAAASGNGRNAILQNKCVFRGCPTQVNKDGVDLYEFSSFPIPSQIFFEPFNSFLKAMHAAGPVDANAEKYRLLIIEGLGVLSSTTYASQGEPKWNAKIIYFLESLFPPEHRSSRLTFKALVLAN